MTESIDDPVWSMVNSGTNEKKITVTYYPLNIESPVYFLKGTTTGRAGVELKTCITASSNVPKSANECTGTVIGVNESITENTWYMVKSGEMASIIVSANGSWSAVTSDGTNISESELTIKSIGT